MPRRPRHAINDLPAFGQYVDTASTELLLARSSLQSARALAEPEIAKSLATFEQCLLAIEGMLPKIKELNTGLKAVA